MRSCFCTATFQYAVPDHGPLPDWTLPTAPPYVRTIHGLLLDEAGKAVPQQEMRLIGEYGRALSATTNAQGEFLWTINGGYIGQGVALIRAGGKIVPLTIVRDPSIAQNPVLLQNFILGLPAAVKGIVRDPHGPVPNATVLIRPNFASGFLLTARTDKNGAYEVKDIPPGKYIVTAESPAHTRRPPRTFEFEIPSTTLAAGATATADITVEPVALVCGQVLDSARQPVAGALVAILSNWRDATQKQWRFEFTDAEGNFLLGTGHTTEKLTLYAFSGTEGLGTASIEPIGAGSMRTTVVQLPGSLRVKGIIADPQGRPLKDVSATARGLTFTTGADGQFDLGRVSLDSSRAPLSIDLRAPRPRPANLLRLGSFGGSAYVDVESREKAPVFYLHKTQTLGGVPADAANLKLTLAPAELLALTGVAQDALGKPLPNAEVYLLTGDTDPATWLESARPSEMRGSKDFRNTLLVAVHADAQGRFTFWLIRDDTPAYTADLSQLCVGLYADNQSALLRDLAFPKNTPEHKVIVQLPATPP